MLEISYLVFRYVIPNFKFDLEYHITLEEKYIFSMIALKTNENDS